MARPEKRPSRVTPSGTHRPGDAPAPSYGRHARRTSPTWLGVLIGVALLLGIVLIFLNYLGALLPGSPSNIWLLVGLGCLLVGIIAATQYH